MSYPTVRNRLTGALTALGLTGAVPDAGGPTAAAAAPAADEAVPEDTVARRRDALTALARGEISADDAARVLRELS